VGGLYLEAMLFQVPSKATENGRYYVLAENRQTESILTEKEMGKGKK
jgi:hypothetical protein